MTSSQQRPTQSKYGDRDLSGHMGAGGAALLAIVAIVFLAIVLLAVGFLIAGLSGH